MGTEEVKATWNYQFQNFVLAMLRFRLEGVRMQKMGGKIPSAFPQCAHVCKFSDAGVPCNTADLAACRAGVGNYGPFTTCGIQL